MILKKRKENRIGTAAKRRYDLPFQKDIGTRYMMVVITLMVFLGFLSMALHISMSALSDRWTSGLEGKMTVEIPAQGLNQDMRDKDEMAAITTRIQNYLEAHSAVTSIDVMAEDELIAMVAPWLGDQPTQMDIPLPVLISIDLYRDLTEAQLSAMKNHIIEIDAASRLDTHQNWLDELLRFTGAIKMVSIVMALVIALTTLMAVAGVVRARLAAHMDDVELLHLMGATDNYIAHQFQRHILILSSKGCIIGALLGALMIKIIASIAGNMGFALLPDFSFNAGHWLIMAFIPFTILILCFITARNTLRRALQKMP